MRKLLFCCMIGISFFACKEKEVNKDIIPFNKMKVVMLQLLQVDEYYNRMNMRDSTLRIEQKNVKFYKQVFDLNGVKRADFYATLAYYEARPIEFKVLMDSVNALCKKNKLKYAPEVK